MVEFWVPDQSAGEVVAVSELEARPVRDCVARWQLERGARRLPRVPDAVTGAVSRNVILIAVVGEGEDYEYRAVGEALLAGFGEDFSGRRLSDIEASTPRFGIGLRMLYEMVRAGCEPLCYRGWAGSDMPGAQFVYYESAILPFGREETRADQLAVVSMLVPRDRSYAPAPQSLRM